MALCGSMVKPHLSVSHVSEGKCAKVWAFLENPQKTTWQGGDFESVGRCLW